MKLKFMTPRQVSKDQHWLKDEIEKERIEKKQSKLQKEGKMMKKKRK